MPSVPSSPRVEIAAQTAVDYKVSGFSVDLSNADVAAGFAAYSISARDSDGDVIRTISNGDELPIEWVVLTFPSESAAFMAAASDLIYKIAKNKGEIPA
jgi:hypothetical protein